MIHAYNECYLYNAMQNLGEAFDYAFNDIELDLDTFMDLFISTGFSESFGKGNPKVISGLSGTELVMEIISKSGITNVSFVKPQLDFDVSPEYWCGWILAYYQWETGMSFKKIHNYISIKEIRKLYNPLHEASEDKFVDTLNSIISKKNKFSNLKLKRKLTGLSQKELSEKSGVNLRTLQQYESKAKDINKASVSSIKALADVLGCSIEDIMEY